MIYSVIREQGVTFAVVQVKGYVIQSQRESARMIAVLRPEFGSIPIALMGTNASSRVTYRGRQDIARFLASINPARIPWKKRRLTA